MADITFSILGGNVYLFNEQWVIKYPEKGKAFPWHQDSGYVLYKDNNSTHKPYLSCWCPLDDVNKSNGTIYILPHSEMNTKNKVLKHYKDKDSNDIIGYNGVKKGIEIEASAGSIVLFSSYNLHRSSQNKSKNERRVYLIQYSKEKIKNSFDNNLWNKAEVFLKNGNIKKRIKNEISK